MYASADFEQHVQRDLRRLGDLAEEQLHLQRQQLAEARTANRIAMLQALVAENPDQRAATVLKAELLRELQI